MRPIINSTSKMLSYISLLMLLLLFIGGDGASASANAILATSSSAEDKQVSPSSALLPLPNIQHLPLGLPPGPPSLEKKSISARDAQEEDSKDKEEKPKEPKEKRQRFCDTQDPPEDTLAEIKKLHEKEEKEKKEKEKEKDKSGSLGLGSLVKRYSGSLAALAKRQITETNGQRALNVDTWFHLVTSQQRNGSITPEMMDRQFAALQGSFFRHRITFRLLGRTNTINDNWATGTNDTFMKRSLRRGNYGTLNIYFLTSLQGGTLGRCNLPGSISTSPTGSNPLFTQDGCIVSADTMPGGRLRPFNEGQTAVHETGHWLGLLHTFQGFSCSGPGDFIGDTPQQRTSTDGCPGAFGEGPVKDSCPNQAGLDAVHNFMDYSDDSCYQSFTLQQEIRMYSMWDTFRAGK
ncbi:MAG: hypothetical protein M1823_004452 [Watsoniomyces obsoletus]|nr:MAG: hypothetical protein M1823_004452 [Watsoniomyces obsoletus]